MKTRFAILPIVFASFFILPTWAWSGGIIQEMRTENPGQSSHGLAAVRSEPIDKSKEVSFQNELMPEKEPPPKEVLKPKTCELLTKGCMIQSEYNLETKKMNLRWKQKTQNGIKASHYLIYRWTKRAPIWTLIAKVSGETFSYTEQISSLEEKGTHFYKVVAVFKVGEEFSHWRYPSQQLTVEKNKAGTPKIEAPQVGMGCQAVPGSHTNGLLWLLLMPLLLLTLRRKSTS